VAPETSFVTGHGLRLFGQVRDAQPLVEERIGGDRHAQRDDVTERVADIRQTIGEPVPKTVAIEHRHHHVDVRLVLDESLPRVLHRALPDAVELNPILRLEAAGQRQEVLRVHPQRVGVALVADQLIALVGNLARRRGRPVALDGLRDDDHRAPVGRIPALERPHRRHDPIVIVAVVDREYVPAV
jgi:hypothetical protein